MHKKKGGRNGGKGDDFMPVKSGGKGMGKNFPTSRREELLEQESAFCHD